MMHKEVGMGAGVVGLLMLTYLWPTGLVLLAGGFLALALVAAIVVAFHDGHRLEP